jgi:hypothetical protein
MTRFNEILNGIKEKISTEAAQKTYKGQKRSDLKDSDFLFPETRSFPIVTPRDIPDAINNFGRMKGPMSYDAFLKKLYNMAKRKGPAFVAALPDASKEKLGIKKSKAGMPFNMGDKVVNVNPNCMHYGSKGKVCGFEKLPNEMGDVVMYETTNAGKNWKMGETLKKTANQLSYDYDDEEDMFTTMPSEVDGPYVISEDDKMEETPEMEEESPEDELMEYKEDFYEMSLGSLRAIATHANEILNSLDMPHVKENLTESWLQGKIAITEDYMRTIHDFIMYVSEAADNISAADRPGLWENIRKKRERMGKKYKPAKPGDKDRPDPEQWKKLTK